MNYANIKPNDIANGPGIRVSLFVSGCNHKCKNCFNEEAWDFNYGNLFTNETIYQITELMKPDHIQGFSILGGEPLDPQNQNGVFTVLQWVKRLYPTKDIWIYTGYTLENDLIYDGSRAKTSFTSSILNMTDVLVDGPFIEAKKDVSLAFRGSSNQRIIDMKRTIYSNYDDVYVLNAYE